MGSPSGLLEGSVLSLLVAPPFAGLALPCQEYLPLAYSEFVNSATAGVERVLLKESSERMQRVSGLSVRVFTLAGRPACTKKNSKSKLNNCVLKDLDYFANEKL